MERRNPSSGDGPNDVATQQPVVCRSSVCLLLLWLVVVVRHPKQFLGEVVVVVVGRGCQLRCGSKLQTVAECLSNSGSNVVVVGNSEQGYYLP